MAQKRMFSMKIVDSDAFLEMPLSTQCLYFHLNMRADDDGFVGNPRKIMRLINSSEDDLKVLIAKRFVLPFDNSVMVIKHWLIHNTIQSDRYKPTVYADEKQQLFVKANKAYTLTPQETPQLPEKTEENEQEKVEKDDVSKMETKCFQNGITDIDLDIGRDLVLGKELNTTNTTPTESILLVKGSTAVSKIKEHLRKNCHLNFYLNRLNEDVKSNPKLQIHCDAFNTVLEALYSPLNESDVKAVLQLTEDKLIKLVDKFISQFAGRTEIENARGYVWTSVYNAIKENNDNGN